MDKITQSVETVIQLDKISDTERLDLVQEVLNNELDLTNPKLVKILKEYLTSKQLPTENMKTQNLKESEQDGEISCLCMFNGQLVSGGADGSIKIWNTETMKPSTIIPGSTPITCLAVIRDQLFIGTKGSVIIRDKDLNVVQQLPLLNNDKSDVTCFLDTTNLAGGFIHTGCSSGIIYSIYMSRKETVYRIAGGTYNAKSYIRNMIYYQDKVYVCTKNSIQKANSFLSWPGNDFADNRETKRDWTQIRFIEDELYAFDSEGDIFLLNYTTLTIGKNCIEASKCTSLFPSYVCEYIDSRLFIGTSEGKFWFIKNPITNDPSRGDIHTLCKSGLKSIAQDRNELYIRCTKGHIHGYTIKNGN